jgi:hypothetical protein
MNENANAVGSWRLKHGFAIAIYDRLFAAVPHRSATAPANIIQRRINN